MSTSKPSLTGQQQQGLPYSRPNTPLNHPKQIGVIGLGNIGYFIARNLANHLPTPVLVYNRTTAVSEKLVKEVGENKARILSSVAEIAKEADILITCLASDAVVKTIYEEIVQTLQGLDGKHNEKILVESSTCFPKLAGELDNKVSAVPNAHFIACPVFGAPISADKAQLILVMAGSYRQKKEVAYTLVPAVGKKVIDLGGNVEKALSMKLIGNSFIGGMVEALAESITLAEKTGVGVDIFTDFIKEMFPSPAIVHYAEAIAKDQFDGKQGFNIEGGLKDTGHIRQLAQEYNAAVPTIDAAHRNMLTARALHANGQSKQEVLDWSALAAGLRVAAGLDAFDSKKHAKVVREEE
jgi:3-hydroxyisobutyrate dehydrogenase-like beta-hydroxyacid dehydrogenase